MPSIIF